MAPRWSAFIAILVALVLVTAAPVAGAKKEASVTLTGECSVVATMEYAGLKEGTYVGWFDAYQDGGKKPVKTQLGYTTELGSSGTLVYQTMLLMSAQQRVLQVQGIVAKVGKRNDQVIVKEWSNELTSGCKWT